MAFDPVTAVIELVNKGIDHFFPPSMSEKDKEEMKQKMNMFVATEARTESSEFRNFVLAYEGSASDYTKFPIIGPIVMLLRGFVRPGITYLTAYFDFVYFTDVTIKFTPEQSKLLAIINVIVLVFWFGERVLVNTGLMDALVKVFEKKG